MTHKLIPRFSSGQASARFEEVEGHLLHGGHALELVQVDFAGAAPNPTGGEAASHDDVVRWRTQVMAAMDGIRTGSKLENDLHGIQLGKALDAVIRPSPSDAAHDGGWSFLSLVVFPDVVNARWPVDPGTGALPRDRWVGRQLGRDRNYLKLAWRRWLALGPIIESANVPLGEDEFGSLLERSALARNIKLVRAAAREIVAFDGEGSRMDFTRELMKRVTYQTGPLNLDLLVDAELDELVRRCASAVSSMTSAGHAREGTSVASEVGRPMAGDDNRAHGGGPYSLEQTAGLAGRRFAEPSRMPTCYTEADRLEPDSPATSEELVLWRPGLAGGLATLDALPAEDTARTLVARLLARGIAVEGPIHRERLAKLAASAFGMRRVAPFRVEAILGCLADRADASGTYWPPGVSPAVWAVYRPDPLAQRQLEYIPQIELANAMRGVCTRYGAMEPETLWAETLRVFGFKRRTDYFVELLQRGASAAVRTGRLWYDVKDDLYEVPN